MSVNLIDDFECLLLLKFSLFAQHLFQVTLSTVLQHHVDIIFSSEAVNNPDNEWTVFLFHPVR